MQWSSHHHPHQSTFFHLITYACGHLLIIYKTFGRWLDVTVTYAYAHIVLPLPHMLHNRLVLSHEEDVEITKQWMKFLAAMMILINAFAWWWWRFLALLSLPLAPPPPLPMERWKWIDRINIPLTQIAWPRNGGWGVEGIEWGGLVMLDYPMLNPMMVMGDCVCCYWSTLRSHVCIVLKSFTLKRAGEKWFGHPKGWMNTTCRHRQHEAFDIDFLKQTMKNNRI